MGIPHAAAKSDHARLVATRTSCPASASPMANASCGCTSPRVPYPSNVTRTATSNGPSGRRTYQLSVVSIRPVRIVLLAVGSRGDVQPFVELGVGLEAAGFEVVVATHPPY